MAHAVATEKPFAEEFATFAAETAFGVDGLRHVRARAFDRFAALGWPSVRDEEWRHTNIAPIARLPFVRAAAATLDRASLAPFVLDGVIGRVVVVNGRLSPELSDISRLPNGISVQGLEMRPDAASSVPETA